MKNKFGISPMIGYVLLITFVIIISAVVYQQLKTYVPKEGLDCPDGVSLFIKDKSCQDSEIILELENNGRFDIGGYYIYASNTSSQDVATIKLSNYADGLQLLDPGIKFAGPLNSFKSGQRVIHKFNLSGTFYSQIKSIEIIPMRWQEENNRQRILSCGNAKIKEKLIGCIIT